MVRLIDRGRIQSDIIQTQRGLEPRATLKKCHWCFPHSRGKGGGATTMPTANNTNNNRSCCSSMPLFDQPLNSQSWADWTPMQVELFRCGNDLPLKMRGVVGRKQASDTLEAWILDAPISHHHAFPTMRNLTQSWLARFSVVSPVESSVDKLIKG